MPGDRIEPLGFGDAVQQGGGFHPVPHLAPGGDLGQRTSFDANPGSSVGASSERAPFAHQGLLVEAKVETVLYVAEYVLDGLLPKVPRHRI
jgi:hypothetical protein